MERQSKYGKERRDERSQWSWARKRNTRSPRQDKAATIRCSSHSTWLTPPPMRHAAISAGTTGREDVNDARGTRYWNDAAAPPDLLTDAPQLNITNVIAPNGGRIYVDHAHPNTPAPETTDPFEAVRYDRASDLIMRAAAAKASETTGRENRAAPQQRRRQRASWGTHENSHDAAVGTVRPGERLMTTHFVSRQIFIGSGRVGIGEHSETPATS